MKYTILKVFIFLLSSLQFSFAHSGKIQVKYVDEDTGFSESRHYEVVFEVQGDVYADFLDDSIDVLPYKLKLKGKRDDITLERGEIYLGSFEKRNIDVRFIGVVSDRLDSLVRRHYKESEEINYISLVNVTYKNKYSIPNSKAQLTFKARGEVAIPVVFAEAMYGVRYNDFHFQNKHQFETLFQDDLNYTRTSNGPVMDYQVNDHLKINAYYKRVKVNMETQESFELKENEYGIGFSLKF